MKSGHTGFGDSYLLDDIGAVLDRISAIDAGENAEVQVDVDGPAATRVQLIDRFALPAQRVRASRMKIVSRRWHQHSNVDSRARFGDDVLFVQRMAYPGDSIVPLPAPHRFESIPKKAPTGALGWHLVD